MLCKMTPRAFTSSFTELNFCSREQAAKNVNCKDFYNSFD